MIWPAMSPPRGSICVDGVSLTVVGVGADDDGHWFSVALIPTTLSQTTLGSCAVGDTVNLEVDVIAGTSSGCSLRRTAVIPADRLFAEEDQEEHHRPPAQADKEAPSDQQVELILWPPRSKPSPPVGPWSSSTTPTARMRAI